MIYVAGKEHGEPLCGLMAREGAPPHGEPHEAVGIAEVEGAVVAGGRDVFAIRGLGISHGRGARRWRPRGPGARQSPRQRGGRGGTA